MSAFLCSWAPCLEPSSLRGHETSSRNQSWLQRSARRRASFRMQQNGSSIDDESPSDTGIAEPVKTAADILSGYAERRENLKTQLYELAATTDRGQRATPDQQSSMESVVTALEELNPTTSPVNTDLIDGKWSLIYSSSKFYKSSPFLLASATPLLQVGQIRQTIYVDAGEFTNEVEVVAFPAISAILSTKARITPVGAERLELTVEKTTIQGDKVAERLDLGGIKVDVPIEQVFQRLRNTSPETFLDTFYLDDRIRISRSKGGTLFIFTRTFA